MYSGDYGRRLVNTKKRERSDHDAKIPDLTYVTNQDSLYTVVEKMATLHIHRVYVVDGDKKPIRVVTQNDIMREILGK